MIPFELSELPHTWFIDLDGTVLVHNAHLYSEDKLLPGVVELWKKIPTDDYIIITTGRTEQYRESTLALLQENGLRYNFALFELPLGETKVFYDKQFTGITRHICVKSYN